MGNSPKRPKNLGTIPSSELPHHLTHAHLTTVAAAILDDVREGAAILTKTSATHRLTLQHARNRLASVPHSSSLPSSL